jgi:predicted GNAT family N-acyltransferase
MNEVTVELIDTSSSTYQQVWDLREEILRKPLGMSLKNEDLSRDHDDAILAAMCDERVIGCVMGHHVNADTLQLRQMAVYNEWQGKGIGRVLINAAEDYARRNDYSEIMLHARKTAMNFYSGLGYTPEGDEYTEVGIPHYTMRKSLSPTT